MIAALSKAIHRIRMGTHDPSKAHERVKGMYSWDDVARRTEDVYRGIIEGPEQRGTYERMMRSVRNSLMLFTFFHPPCLGVGDALTS